MAEVTRHKKLEGEIRSQFSIAMQDLKSSLQIMVDALESILFDNFQNKLEGEVEEL